MNFLAHIYLSGDSDFIKIGNFIADGIRGKQYLTYHPEIQKGILMHRQIDTYTDMHPIFRQSTKKLHQSYGHYSGIIIDLFYDHFLAKNWSNHSAIPIDVFIADFYTLLQNNIQLTSSRAQQITPYMVADNWLLKYQTFEGISNILHQMDRRTGFKSNMQQAPIELQNYYSDFENEFELFFSDIKPFCQSILDNR